MNKSWTAGLGVLALALAHGSARADNANATANPPAYTPGTQSQSMDLQGNLRVGQSDAVNTGNLSLTTLNNAVTLPVARGESTLRFSTSGIASSGAVVSVQGSMDGTTWTSPALGINTSSGPVFSTLSNADQIGAYAAVGGYQFVRFVVTTAGTGSASIVSAASVAPSTAVTSSLPAGSSNIGSVSPSAIATLGATAATIVAAATTNATLVSTGSHNVYGLQCFTTNTTIARYIKVFSKATAPVPGTDTPVGVFEIPPAALAGANPVSYALPTVGLLLPLGFGYAITTNPALNDATVLSAADTWCSVQYK